MNIHFEEPPEAQRIGGLEAAIRALESALQQRGLHVSSGTGNQAEPGDVVHFHGIWQPNHARLSKALTKRKVATVVSPHGMLEPWAWRHKWWKKWPYYWLVERDHLRRARAILATAPVEARRLQAMLPRQKIESIPLGLTDGAPAPNYEAARTTLGWSPDEIVLLFLSRLHRKKGLELLLQALASMPLPANVRLVVVGSGEPGYLKYLHHLTDSFATVLPRVEWAGQIWGDQRWPYFQGADLFCLPSYSENFGLAVLEACQVGTIALTTDTTPWGEWLTSERGIIVRPNVNSVMEGLQQFFANRPTPDTRSRLAEWARSTFSWNTLAPKYVQFYRDLAARD